MCEALVLQKREYFQILCENILSLVFAHIVDEMIYSILTLYKSCVKNASWRAFWKWRYWVENLIEVLRIALQKFKYLQIFWDNLSNLKFVHIVDILLYDIFKIYKTSINNGSWKALWKWHYWVEYLFKVLGIREALVFQKCNYFQILWENFNICTYSICIDIWHSQII